MERGGPSALRPGLLWLGAALVGALLAACSATAVAAELIDGDPTRPCEAVNHAGGVRALSCQEAVAAAAARLGDHGPIRSVVFVRAGSLMPECQGIPVPCSYPQMGSVYFEFWVGDPTAVGVTLENGVPVAHAPGPGDIHELLVD